MRRHLLRVALGRACAASAVTLEGARWRTAPGSAAQWRVSWQALQAGGALSALPLLPLVSCVVILPLLLPLLLLLLLPPLGSCSCCLMKLCWGRNGVDHVPVGR
jgi:hypothetical protein